MHKWQEENPNDRAVLCIATDNGRSINTLFGKSLPLICALFAVMIEDSAWVDVCKGALIAKENPIAALALIHALEESKKEGEASTKEEEEAPDEPSIKRSLKDLFKILADKL